MPEPELGPGPEPEPGDVESATAAPAGPPAQWPLLDAQLPDLAAAIVALPGDRPTAVLKALFLDAAVQATMKAPRTTLLCPAVVDTLVTLCLHRQNQIVSVEPAFSWCMPHANLPDQPDVEDFLRGPSETYNVTNFNSSKDARRFCDYYCTGAVKNGYSMRGERCRRDVLVAKTKAYFETLKQAFATDQAERSLLRSLLDAAGSENAGAGARAASSSSSASEAAVKPGHVMIDLTDDLDGAENADNGAAKKQRT